MISFMFEKVQFLRTIILSIYCMYLKHITLPKTNIAGWKIQHFVGIYKET